MLVRLSWGSIPGVCAKAFEGFLVAISPMQAFQEISTPPAPEPPAVVLRRAVVLGASMAA